MTADFRRIAIVNRGEPAMRFIHAVREYNLEHQTAIQVIALYTEPDRQARFVREADEAVFLGDPTFLDQRDGLRRQAYLNYPLLERVIGDARADAVWAGWGFVGERPEFVELCERKGVTFIGPDSGAMRRLGDKINAKRLAEQAGIPTVPWGGTPVPSLESALVHAERLGYPVALKASAGAGGRGIQRVDQPSEMDAALKAVRLDASRMFNDATVFLERWLGGVRHVEVQVQADHHGTVWALGTRDCSVQRRWQKLMSEAPAPGLGPDVESGLLDAAVRLVAAAQYRSQVSLEFLVEPSGRFHFLEANTRLQVEHVVTELTSGVDLVKLELHVARGGRLDGTPPATKGHAVEVRLNAEDPHNGFAASPGTISLFRLATGPGLRVDTGVAEGDTMPPEFGAMFAKLAASGHARDEALGRLVRALSESAIVVTGGPTNRSFLLRMLATADVRRGAVDTAWLDGMMAAEEALPERHAKIALLEAAIEVYDVEFGAEVDAFFGAAARLRPVVRAEVGRPIELSYRGHRYALRVLRIGQGRYRIDTGGGRLDVEIERLGPNERWMTCDGRRYRVVAAVHGYTVQVEVEGVPHAIARADEGIVRGTSPAVVVAVNVRTGDVVAAGERLVVLEAMKMEMAITAPFAGTVRQVFILPNAQVGAGTPLVHLDALQDGRRRQAGPRVALDGAAEPAPRVPSRARALLRGVKVGLRELKKGGAPTLPVIMTSLRAAMLGFDVDATDVGRLLQEYQRACQSTPPGDADLTRFEDDLLRIFVDVRALFGRQMTDEEDVAVQTLGTEQYFYTYLRTLDGKGVDLPSAFVEKLVAALGHYGLAGLDLGPQLRESLLWIFKAQQRGDIQAPILKAILDRRLLYADDLAPGTPSFLALIQRLIAALQGRIASLVDTARDVQYRYVDQPAFERVRGVVQEEMLGLVAGLATGGAYAEDDERLVELVECTQPLRTVLAGSLASLDWETRLVTLDVMVRRDYRIRALRDVTRRRDTDPPTIMATYDYDGQPIHLLASCAPASEFDRALAGARALAAELPPDQDVAFELYLWGSEPAGDPDTLAEALSSRLESAGFDRPLRRTVVTVVPGILNGTSDALQYFTFRPFGPGYREDRVYRGLHPMLGKRLQIWRLNQFFLERLPSVEDVYVFRAVARENARDERLVALAEVRDASPLRDGAGRLVSVPHLERMAIEGLMAIRRAHLRRSPEERLHWNRLVLFVRPPLPMTRAEIEQVALRIAEQADGLGLEKAVIRGDMPDEGGGDRRDTVLSVSLGTGRAPVLRFSNPSDDPIRTLSDYDQKVVRMRQRGLTYPYEIVRMLTAPQARPDGDLPPGEFTELDLDADGQLVAVGRPHGQNSANIVAGIIRNFTVKYPEGMTRVVLLGDPSREVGSLAEPECRRILGAIDLATRLQVPIEWFALSAGAKISMASGTENMDWISRVLRGLIVFTQAGGEVNIVVTGINVGAQPYWNAEATMLMHTRGILIMMPESAMVLTGKTALDYSGSVSAEDNLGIGGYEHIMGPNGQAQYFGKDLREAVQILMRHYDYCYRAPGEPFPRRASTADPADRDIRAFPHGGGAGSFATIGDVFSDEKNPGRKKPFEIRRVMLAVTDQDHPPLERWAGWRDAEIGVTWDAHIGGYPVSLLGFESRPVPRLGLVPADGPDQYTSGTLFPMASKKIARAVNAASGNRPLVILANLSGFDGSPESMRRRQLEYGAEIGRAVVNFKGPIIFTVVSRYHGGAFVVFSKALNPDMEVAALEGSYASVIGGAPAAAVVFARDVDARTRKDPRVIAADQALKAASEFQRPAMRAQLDITTRSVRSEKLGEVADEFDRIHSVHRALEVGSLDRIIRAADLRPYLIDAIQRGMAKYLTSL
jgi:acetyl/propionyl-CoA carboxylase alpha subunit/acetyl-CoA carboxylase carboxyltransferase component